MKQILHLLPIALFMTLLWLPPLCTPRLCRQEQDILEVAERRNPDGTLSFKDYSRDVEQWVEQAQLWYQDSFAFRSRLLTLYNVAHYQIHNYPAEFYGKEGHLFRKGHETKKLHPLSASKLERIQKNIENLSQVCSQTGTPCLFVLVPSKQTVHPQLAPRWLRERPFDPKRKSLIALIRKNNFPVLDLSTALKNAAEKTGEILYNKYDNHWNIYGALIGYREMISVIRELLPVARMVTEEELSLTHNEYDTRYTDRLYLGGFLSEPITDITGINLPPLRIIKRGKEEHHAVHIVYRRGRTDVFCQDREDSTVVFIRDSFLRLPSQLLNHGFAHSIYFNHSEEGRNLREIIEVDRPDLLVFALHEAAMQNCLRRLLE